MRKKSKLDKFFAHFPTFRPQKPSEFWILLFIWTSYIIAHNIIFPFLPNEHLKTFLAGLLNPFLCGLGWFAGIFLFPSSIKKYLKYFLVTLIILGLTLLGTYAHVHLPWFMPHDDIALFFTLLPGVVFGVALAWIDNKLTERSR